MSRLIFEFLHVMSGMAVFFALGMEGVALYQYRHASGAAQVQGAVNGFEAAHRAAPLSGAATILSGMYLAQTVWGWHAAWINTALASVIIVAAISASTAAPQAARMRAGLQPRESTLGSSFTTRTGILIGILFLMTVKPPLNISLLAVTSAAGLGFLVGVRPSRARIPVRSVQ